VSNDSTADWDQTGRGPGYERLHASRRKSGTIEGRATVVEELPTKGGMVCGVRVFHQKFGYGTIQSMDGNKLEIAFEKAGTKKVLDSFVVPT
jgi:DNA helicase-2/ATP-dependent DNA helicase PcrA